MSVYTQTAAYRHVDILAPQLENFIQDNFPDVEEENLPGVAKALVEIVLTEHRSLLLKEEKDADKVSREARDAAMKKASRKPPTQYTQEHLPDKLSKHKDWGGKDSHDWRTNRSSAIGAR
jgi:hypothetical protein